jgi:hypothetical protein
LSEIIIQELRVFVYSICSGPVFLAIGLILCDEFFYRFARPPLNLFPNFLRSLLQCIAHAVIVQTIRRRSLTSHAASDDVQWVVHTQDDAVVSCFGAAQHQLRAYLWEH